MAADSLEGHKEPSRSEIQMVIGASSAGTVFEWYDFFIYGTLGSILSKTFFPTGNATLEMLLFWLVFAVGFGFRPLGAILFGYLGDKLGRKYTFLVTVTLMGIATAGVGLIPSAESIGMAAPIIIIILRILQGLALGGEYGGAAIYVAEHSAPSRRGFFTSFIQASVVGGFVLSLVVVLSCKALMTPETWMAWGWRVPFLLSILLLAISLWMRLKLSESPVFRAMQEEGEVAGNPFVESFTYPGNRKRIFIALFGVAAGLTVIWYTAMFSALSFLKASMRIEDTPAELIVGAGAALGMVFFIVFGKLSDRIGRKLPIVVGYGLTLLLLFPAFWLIGAHANPDLAEAARRAPVVVSGPACEYSPFATEQKNQCGKLLGDLSGAGVAYTVTKAETFSAAVGGAALPLEAYAWDDKAARGTQLQDWLGAAGYNFAKVTPTAGDAAMMVAGLLLLMFLSGMTYGPVAALLSEMFPPRIRYSSMSIPYHIGTGYFGGFLPVISTYIVARTGDPYAGLWYTWIIVAVALAVSAWGLKSGPRAISAKRMANLPPAALRLDIDRDALMANWQVLDGLSGAASAGAAVKADAYGLGARAVVPVLHAAGCRDFYVTYSNEAADLLDLVDPAGIALLHGPISRQDAEFARAKGVRPVINSLMQARRWLETGGGRCDLMVDTGINRLGLTMDMLGDEAVRRLDVDVLLSHLASADEDVPLNAQQLARWQEARRLLPHRRASLANSAGILLGEAYHGDLTRPGLALYGGVPCPALAGLIRQVARPMAAIMQVRHLSAGDGVGYNSTFVADRPMRAGVVALGYADGYLRCWSGKGQMLHCGRRLSLLGRVSMDMVVIDLAEAPDLDEGDWVEVAYSLPEAAAISGLSQYELITLLADRFAR